MTQAQSGKWGAFPQEKRQIIDFSGTIKPKHDIDLLALFFLKDLFLAKQNANYSPHPITLNLSLYLQSQDIAL